MDEVLDERRFAELAEESDDLQSAAMRATTHGLGNYVEAAREARFEQRSERRSLAPAAVAAGALGLATFAWAGSAFADSSADTMALQTAAGLENLAVFTYKTALTLPFIGGSSANAVVKAFAMKTMAQHLEHSMAFNAAAVKLGGKAQKGTDPKYTPIVQKAVPTLKGPADVVGLAVTLENVASQTYVKDIGLVSSPELRQLFASVAGVEAQHRAVLLAVQALLKAGAADLIALPPDVAKLPAAAGSVAFPASFYPTSMAAPVEEGAVK